MISFVLCVWADCALASIGTDGLLGSALACVSRSLALVWIIFESFRCWVETTLFTKLTFSSSAAQSQRTELKIISCRINTSVHRHRYVAKFCDSLGRAAITKRATRWESTTPARTEERGLSRSSSMALLRLAVGCSASRSISNTSQSTIEDRLSVV